MSAHVKIISIFLILKRKSILSKFARGKRNYGVAFHPKWQKSVTICLQCSLYIDLHHLYRQNQHFFLLISFIPYMQKIFHNFKLYHFYLLQLFQAGFGNESHILLFDCQKWNRLYFQQMGFANLPFCLILLLIICFLPMPAPKAFLLVLTWNYDESSLEQLHY